MEYFILILSFIPLVVRASIPLLFGAVGEIMTEKSGNLNLGIPGIMYVGLISGYCGGFIYEYHVEEPNAFVCVLIAMMASILGSLLVSLVYSFLTITLKANQNVVGLALTTMGIGIDSYYGGNIAKIVASSETGSGELLNKIAATSEAFKTPIPIISDHLGKFGEVFFSYGFLFYLAIIIAIVASRTLNKTRIGLNLRAVGEAPATADAAGINVSLYKYMATCIGGVIAGLGGLFFIVEVASGTWESGAFGDRGWLAIAIVIFALWKPSMAIISSFAFGALCALPNKPELLGVSSADTKINAIIGMLPYLVTIIVLVFTSSRKKKEHQPPQSLGLSYFREER